MLKNKTGNYPRASVARETAAPARLLREFGFNPRIDGSWDYFYGSLKGHEALKQLNNWELDQDADANGGIYDLA